MRVTILGSGTCVPRLDRSACAVLVETGKPKILLDLGPGTMRRMLRCSVSIFALTHILISHFHPDHTAELAPLLFATKYPDNAARTQPLYLVGANGPKRFYQGLRAAYGDWIVPPAGQLIVREIDTLGGEVVHGDDFEAIAQPVAHRPESLAYRIQADHATLAYSGDSEPCQGLVAAAHQADLFICESAMPDERRVPGHMTPSLAGRMATQAQARHLVLTHLYPACDQVDIVKQAQGTYKGPVTVAEDLMRFELPDGIPGNKMRYYPICLDITDRPCLVVGGGRVGTRKVRTLLDCGARVTVISPEGTAELAELAQQGRVTWERRDYRDGDQAGAFLVIGATDVEALNRQVYQEAEAAGRLCNIADQPERCNFVLPAIIQQGDLTIAVSTSGKSPAFAKHLRRVLEAQFGPEYAIFLDLMGAVRRRLLAQAHAPEAHKPIFEQLIAQGLLDLIRRDDRPAIDRVLTQVVGAAFRYEDLLAEEG